MPSSTLIHTYIHTMAYQTTRSALSCRIGDGDLEHILSASLQQRSRYTVNPPGSRRDEQGETGIIKNFYCEAYTWPSAESWRYYTDRRFRSQVWVQFRLHYAHEPPNPRAPYVPWSAKQSAGSSSCTQYDPMGEGPNPDWWKDWY